MKKIMIIVMTLSIIFITGCEKKNSNLDLKLSKGDFTSVCTKKDDSDGIKLTSTTTTNYDNDKYAINMKVKAIYKYNDKKTFDFYAEEAINTANTYETMDGIVYKYQLDKKNKTITTLLGYKKLDINEQEKENYTLKKIVEDSEKDGGKCQLVDITREDAGLSNN